MKKVFYLILSIFFILALCGCSKSQTSVQSDVNTQTAEKKEDKQETQPQEQEADVNAEVKILAPAKVFKSADEIPAYKDNACTILNDNQPYFTEDEITSKAFEYYGDLDSLKRCTVAGGCLGKETMPAEDEKRGEIGIVKPTGWHQAKYPGLVDSNPPYLYNRAHLAAFCLTAENANEKNLITGTRYMNTAMTDHEIATANYIRKTGNHVMYRVTPVFIGDELLSRGLILEGYSVEDNGAGICFCVFYHNVQPGVNLDYATGQSSIGGETETEPNEEKNEDAQEYILNKSSKKIHKPGCKGLANANPKNLETVTESLSRLQENGYDPCKICLQ